MLKFAIPAAIALFAATPAFAQNDMAPQLGKSDEWKDAPATSAKPASRYVVFTATGTYGDLPSLRLIEVRTDGDVDGDGKPDVGVLRISCTGGDMVTGVFTAGASAAAAADGRKSKIVKANGSSVLAAGKTFKGRWGSTAAADGKPVTLGSDQPDVCVGLS